MFYFNFTYFFFYNFLQHLPFSMYNKNISLKLIKCIVKIKKILFIGEKTIFSKLIIKTFFCCKKHLKTIILLLLLHLIFKAHRDRTYGLRIKFWNYFSEIFYNKEINKEILVNLYDCSKFITF